MWLELWLREIMLHIWTYSSCLCIRLYRWNATLWLVITKYTFFCISNDNYYHCLSISVSPGYTFNKRFIRVPKDLHSIGEQTSLSVCYALVIDECFLDCFSSISQYKRFADRIIRFLIFARSIETWPPRWTSTAEWGMWLLHVLLDNLPIFTIKLIYLAYLRTFAKILFKVNTLLKVN